MEKPTDSGLFVNDGSFMERFKQLQQKEKEKPKSTVNVSGTPTPKLVIGKSSMVIKANEPRRTSQSASGGKLAFSLKQKSKLVAPPVKLGEDEDEEEQEIGNSSDDGPAKQQKLGNPVASIQSSTEVDVGNYSFSLWFISINILQVFALKQTAMHCSCASSISQLKVANALHITNLRGSGKLAVVPFLFGLILVCCPSALVNFPLQITIVVQRP